MTHRILKLGSLLLALLAAHSSFAQRPEYPSLEEMVHQSDIVAVARIEKVPPSEVPDPRPGSCGDVYRAKIVDSIKGDRGEPTFVVPRETRVSPASEHVVVLQAQDRDLTEDQIKRVAPGISRAALEHALCMARAAEYRIFAFPPGIVAFDEDAAAKLGGRWLEATYPSFAASVGFEKAIVVDGKDERMVASWKDVRNALAAAAASGSH